MKKSVQDLVAGRLEEIRHILQNEPGFRNDKESMAAYICVLTIEGAIRLIGESDALFDFTSVCHDFAERRSRMEMEASGQEPW